MNEAKIGKFIAAMRKERNFTQRELADLLGISDKTVSKWECGNGMPELSLMRPLCELLQISLNELFSGERLSDAAYRKKAEETILSLLQKAEESKSNIVGGEVLGEARNVELDTDEAHQTNDAFWSTVGIDELGVVALPSWGGYISEETLHWLDALSGKKVLEIGCGNGRSLQYVHEHGAEELWGIDLSRTQIDRAKTFLSSRNITADLICAPMENDCGLPVSYFDIVYSVFGIGWTTDLHTTFRRIYSYLKPGGVFLFNWSHPIHKCTCQENGKLVFGNSYFDEGWYSAEIGGREIILSNRMLSTYLNALADCGFRLEQLVEKGDDALLDADRSAFGDKAKIVPVGFAVKARKPGICGHCVEN